MKRDSYTYEPNIWKEIRKNKNLFHLYLHESFKEKIAGMQQIHKKDPDIIIRSLLNKLTKENIHENIQLIQQELSSIEQDEETYKKACDILFQNTTKQSFNREIHIQLYHALQSSNMYLNECLFLDISKCIPYILTIKKIDPNEEYDLFCKQNEEIDKHRCFLHFCVDYLAYIKCKNKQLEQALYGIVQSCFKHLENSTYNTIIYDEICETLAIICFKIVIHSNLKTKQYMLFHTSKNYKHIKKKSLFRLMDIREVLETYLNE